MYNLSDFYLNFKQASTHLNQCNLTVKISEMSENCYIYPYVVIIDKSCWNGKLLFICDVWYAYELPLLQLTLSSSRSWRTRKSERQEHWCWNVRPPTLTTSPSSGSRTASPSTGTTRKFWGPQREYAWMTKGGHLKYIQVLENRCTSLNPIECIVEYQM